jgi:hypothetical protein
MQAAVVAVWAVLTKKMNGLRIFEMKTVMEVYGTVKH